MGRSLPSASAAAALAAADLVPVGAVIGCIVMHLGWSESSCGGYTSVSSQPKITPIRISGQHGSRDAKGFETYVRAQYRAYDSTLDRMLSDAALLGADGVVGVDLTWSTLDSGARELTAMGTAVRSRRPERRRQAEVEPFCTELRSEDVAKAVLAGWTPLGIVVGLAVAFKHEDATLHWQTSKLSGPGNVEVVGLTKLVRAARSQARYRLTERAGRFPAAAQLIVSTTDLRRTVVPCSPRRDHVAEARFIGTALAHDPQQAQKRPQQRLSIFPLGNDSRSSRGMT